METDFNLYKLLEENKPDDVTDKDFIIWYENELVKAITVFSKSYMDNKHVPMIKDSTIWELTNSNDNYEYVIKVKRFRKISLGAVVYFFQKIFRAVGKYLRTLDTE
jgi:hypothetical protein